MSTSPITIPTDTLDMLVGHLVDLSAQGLAVEKTATFRDLIANLLAYSQKSERSLVGLFRPAIVQIYQVRSEGGGFVTKTRKTKDGEEIKTVDTDLTSNIPDWATPISSMTTFGGDARMRQYLEELIGANPSR